MLTKSRQAIASARRVKQYTYAYSTVDMRSGDNDSLILTHVDAQCMQLFRTKFPAATLKSAS